MDNQIVVVFQVNFLGERGVDTGGMTREFFTIIARDIVAVYIRSGTFKHNFVALQVI